MKPVHERALVGEVQLRFDLLARERLLEHAAEVAVAAGAAVRERAWRDPAVREVGPAALGARPRGRPPPWARRRPRRSTAAPRAVAAGLAAGGATPRRAPVARIEGASAGSSTQ